MLKKIFKKNNNSISIAQPTRCHHQKTKQFTNQFYLDHNSQGIIKELTTTLIDNHHNGINIVTVGIVHQPTGTVSLSFLTPRPNTQSFIKYQWHKITHLDSQKKYPNQHNLIDTELGTIYQEIAKRQDIYFTAHLQLVAQTINHHLSNESKASIPTKLVTLDDLIQFKGFAITFKLNNNHLNINFDGKSNTLNLEAPAIYQAINQNKPINKNERYKAILKEIGKRNHGKYKNFMPITEAKKINRLIANEASQIIQYHTQNRIKQIEKCLINIINVFEIQSKKLGLITNYHDGNNFFKQETIFNKITKIKKIINDKGMSDLKKIITLQNLIENDSQLQMLIENGNPVIQDNNVCLFESGKMFTYFI